MIVLLISEVRMSAWMSEFFENETGSGEEAFYTSILKHGSNAIFVLASQFNLGNSVCLCMCLCVSRKSVWVVLFVKSATVATSLAREIFY